VKTIAVISVAKIFTATAKLISIVIPLIFYRESQGI